MKISIRYFILAVSCIACHYSFAKLRPVLMDLRCENLINPIAIDNASPHFSWKIKGEGVTQQQFVEIQVASDSVNLSKGKANLWNSGKEKSSESVMVPYRGKTLTSRQICYWRVRITDQRGKRSDWSEIKRFGIGILPNDKLQGDYIGLASENGQNRTPLLRKSFHVDQLYTTLVHVSSLGYHEVYVNGQKVGKDVLAPAVSQLNKRVWINTYDVTDYLRKGTNEILLWLGEGWYKKTTFGSDFDGPLVKAEMGTVQSGEWKQLLVTDRSWKGRESGYTDLGTWQALRFGGEKIDAQLVPTSLEEKDLNKLSWSPVASVQIPNLMETPQMCEPNTIQETLTAKNIQRIDNNTWLVDFGKVITGWLELTASGLQSGQEIKVRYTDDIKFDPQVTEQGEFDLYLTSGRDKDVFRNKFNHHAFRYVKVENFPAELTAEQIQAHLIHGDYTSAATFVSSDSEMNAIHDMVQYTMKCLTFSGYMVDCPHLERAGYGGDGNSSTQALQMMYDVSPTFATWLQSWEDTMREGGSLPHVAPNPGAGGGGPYWCGFMVMAPWRTYVNYNDPRLITKHYDTMKEWMKYVDTYTVDGLLKRWPDLSYRDWYLGDWLAPIGVDAGAQSSVDLVSNCFISECLGVLEKIAITLDKPEEAKQFADRRNALNTLIHKTFFNAETNVYATGSQLDMCYPMLVGAVPESLYDVVKQTMKDRTATVYNNHIAVGLVGVPILTEWAIQNGEVDFMYNILKQPDYPGYLHMINNDATATWEYWSGERSRVHNCYNGIGTWFYQALGGIRPDDQHPGYCHFYIEPQITDDITWTKSSKETPYGTVQIHWRIESGNLIVDVEIPVGVEARYKIPDQIEEYQVNGKKEKVSGKYRVLVGGKYTLVFAHS